MEPGKAIARFDAFLTARGLSFDAVAIGGTALNLLGVVARPTKDCDILEPKLPSVIADAAKAFAAAERQGGQLLDDHWFNDAPSSLADVLSPGWRERLQLAFRGQALTIRTLGRHDLLCSKVFALCDRGIDLQDCLALAPSLDELRSIESWLAVQDGNPGWPAHVHAVMVDLAGRLGHEF